MRVAIGIPSPDMVHADFAMALCFLVIGSAREGIEVALINQKTSLIEKGRHDIVEAALRLEADKLLFVDTDMVFPSDTLVRLIASGKDIIGANYPTRRVPVKSTCQGMDGKPVDYTKSGIDLVGYIATGCLLIDMSVFKKMEKPYFHVDYVRDANEFLGEDYSFCETVRKLGYNIFCDFDLSKQIAHLGMMPFGLREAKL